MGAATATDEERMSPSSSTPVTATSLTLPPKPLVGIWLPGSLSIQSAFWNELPRADWVPTSHALPVWSLKPILKFGTSSEPTSRLVSLSNDLVKLPLGYFTDGSAKQLPSLRNQAGNSLVILSRPLTASPLSMLIADTHRSSSVSFVSASAQAFSNSPSTSLASWVFPCAFSAAVNPKRERPLRRFRSRSARKTASASACRRARRSAPPRDSRTGEYHAGGSP